MSKTSRMPTNKVAAGVLAGAITAIMVWSIRQFAAIEVPPEIAMAGSTVITFFVQLAVPDAIEPRHEDEDLPTEPADDRQTIDRP